MKKLILIFILSVFFVLSFGLEIEKIGKHQNGKVNHWLDQYIGVKLTDSNGLPISNLPVRFKKLNPKSSLKDTIVYTDNKGIAVTNFKFGKEMGDYTVKSVIEYEGSVLEKSFTFTAFDYKKIIFFVLGGLGLFLFGISKVSESLRYIAGGKLKKILGILTKNRFLGVGVGIGTTSLLQSSSATTVITLGFINAGLINLMQAISIILGANIGTTITAQIIAFKIGDFALPMIAIGAGLILFGKKTRTKYIGHIIFGFGLLFFGLNQMTGVVRPLRKSAFLSNLFVRFSDNPFLAICAGALMTMVVQSSSATVGVTIALAISGLINFPAAVGLVLGDNIGTTITAILASLSSGNNAKRTALAHVLFNVIGATYMIIVFLLFKTPITQFIQTISGNTLHIQGSKYIAREIANFHSIFNIFNTLVFLPFVGLLAKLVTVFIPENGKTTHKVAKYLSPNISNNWELEINQIKLELGRMLKNTKDAVITSLDALAKDDLIKVAEINKLEDLNDLFQLEITDYLVKLSRQELDIEQAQHIPVLLHVTNDFEKVADYAKNIGEITQRKFDKSVVFSEEQKEILQIFGKNILSMLDSLLIAFEHTNILKAREVASLEKSLNFYEEKYKKQEIKKLSKEGSVKSTIMLFDIITNIEKMGDHLYNVAQAVMGTLKEDRKTLYSESLLINTTKEEM